MPPKRPFSYRLISAIVLTPIFAIGIIFFILWLSLRPHHPKFHVHELSVQGLGHTNGFVNANIAFNVTVRNPNRRVLIYYESMRGSVYYKDQRLGVIPVLESYFQEPKYTTVMHHVLSGSTMMATTNNRRWIEFENDRMRGAVNFNLRFKSTIKYKNSMWDKGDHHMRVTCNTAVGGDGMILSNYKGKRCHVHTS
ncbi:Late embryogenesis abundant (LEA) hydroxyproline-rich glycoprotein family [Melia azedarach]|uniref:Late embryogenesis abundant (LEA) hydroxyproline-rich glycoprotein family n=1 Tax=Melia azedarach TaxID=155640 RepID=A0ACC1WVW0_MELAZ|nr:Late embryogenesis abundant (LEA) hydroxyproline-rich glycoprotein family [Melia azedarach]